MEAVIKVEQLSKAYGQLEAVKNFNLAVWRGTIFALLGANGAGKSTALECILGVQKADSGEVSILGLNPLKERKKLFAKVGVQFQEAHYQDKITVSELCEVTASLYPNPADYKKLLTKLGLAAKLKSPVAELSGGQKQSLFLALTLLGNPEVVFLDELTTGLDPQARREVWQMLLELKAQGLTILLVSHFMDEVAFLADRLSILKQGQIIFTGTVAEAIAASPYDNLEEAYIWFNETDKAKQPS